MADNFLEFNVNESVLVKLTDAGKAELLRQHEELRLRLQGRGSVVDIGEAYKLDADGYWRVQLWVLMKALGPMCELGAQMPFDAVIRIPTKS